VPTRKQRRRQQKARRHEYEYVYVDDEGNEVEVDPGELRPQKDGDRSESRTRRNDKRPAQQTRGGRRAPQPPSWRRSVKRAFIMGPIFVVALALINRGVPLAQQIGSGLVVIAFFIPVSYFSESLTYRMYRKRLGGARASKRREGGG